MLKRKKENLESKQKVECMKCGEVLMTENKKKHVIRKHNVESIDFRFHIDSTNKTLFCYQGLKFQLLSIVQGKLEKHCLQYFSSESC